MITENFYVIVEFAMKMKVRAPLLITPTPSS